MLNAKPITDLRKTTEETYEYNQNIAEIYHKLSEAEADLQLGVKPLDGEEVFKRLRAKHGYQ